MKIVRKSIDDMLEKSNQGAERKKGIRCPQCGGVQFAKEGAVRETRRAEDSVIRHRQCPHCGHEFWTTER